MKDKRLRRALRFMEVDPAAAEFDYFNGGAVHEWRSVVHDLTARLKTLEQYLGVQYIESPEAGRYPQYKKVKNSK